MSSANSPYRDFAENLRALSAAKGTVAQVCRDLAMNRQQFNKYMSGTNLPGQATLEKLARYFGVEQRALFHYPQAAIAASSIAGVGPATALDHLNGSIIAAFAKGLSSGENVHLREGCYKVFFPWINGTADVVRAIMVVFKVGGVMCFRRYTLFKDPNNPKARFFHGRHDGIVLQLHGRLFFGGQNTRGFGEISLATFGSTTMPNEPIMTGLAMVYGLTEPIATRVTLEYFGKRKDFSRALRLCGILPGGSPDVPVSMKPSIADNELADPRFISPFGIFDVLKSAAKQAI